MVRIEGSPTEPDGLYEKYRVFREPTRDSQGRPVEEHPVPLDYGPGWHVNYTDKSKVTWYLGDELEEITDEFIFVLKPKTDPHARVALAAYAQSVREEKPQLWADLVNVLGLEIW